MPLRLTFGVEFEFALAALCDGAEDPEPCLPQPPTRLSPDLMQGQPPEYRNVVEGNAIYDMIAAELAAAGLPARPVKQPIYNYEVGDASETDSVPMWHDLEDVYDNKWAVSIDSSIKPPRGWNAYTWFQIEVKSPPYILCDEALDAVRLACNVITSKFRAVVNDSTGLHVHIGQGADGYSLPTMKNLMAFLWTLEPQLEQLHPNRFAPMASPYEATWYESLRRGSLMAQPTFDATTGPSVTQGLHLIYGSTTAEALFDLVRSRSHKSAYYIGHAVARPATHVKKTIEWRQHEGTLDGARAAAWIRTVAAIMAFIIDADKLTLLDFLIRAATFEDCRRPGTVAYDVVDLFEDLGLGEQAAYWDAVLPRGVRRAPALYEAVENDPEEVERKAALRYWLDRLAGPASPEGVEVDGDGAFDVGEMI